MKNINKKKHLVSYLYRDSNDNLGIGNVDVVFNHYPPTINDIRDAESELKRIKNFSADPVILNWLKIAK